MDWEYWYSLAGWLVVAFALFNLLDSAATYLRARAEMFRSIAAGNLKDHGWPDAADRVRRKI